MFSLINCVINVSVITYVNMCAHCLFIVFRTNEKACLLKNVKNVFSFKTRLELTTEVEMNRKWQTEFLLVMLYVLVCTLSGFFSRVFEFYNGPILISARPVDTLKETMVG